MVKRYVPNKSWRNLMKMSKLAKGRFRVTENLSITVQDRFGNLKPVFQPNKLFSTLIQKGILSAKAIKIPFLFGNWSDKLVISNLITNDGFAGMASRCNGSGAEAAFTYIAVGTGVGGAAVGDSTLGTELAADGLTRAAASASLKTTDVTDDTASLTKTFTVTGTQAVTESGVFNAGADGVLLSRQVFAAVNVVDGDSLQITWDYDFD